MVPNALVYLATHSAKSWGEYKREGRHIREGEFSSKSWANMPRHDDIEMTEIWAFAIIHTNSDIFCCNLRIWVARHRKQMELWAFEPANDFLHCVRLIHFIFFWTGDVLRCDFGWLTQRTVRRGEEGPPKVHRFGPGPVLCPHEDIFPIDLHSRFSVEDHSQIYLDYVLYFYFRLRNTSVVETIRSSHQWRDHRVWSVQYHLQGTSSAR